MKPRPFAWVCLPALLLVGAPAQSAPRERPASPQALVGKPAPDFALTDLSGRSWRLSGLRGERIAVLEFASTSCQCGQNALIALDFVQRRFGERGAQALAVGFEAHPLSPPQEFMESAKLTFPFLDDAGLETGRAYAVRWPPSVLIVDRAGIVRWACDEFRSDVFARTRAALEPLLAADEAWNAKSQYGRLYRAGTPVIVRGTVVSIERCVPMRGMSPGVAIAVREGKRVRSVQLGPEWYVASQPVKIAAKSAVTVNGVLVSLNGKAVVLAAEVKSGNGVLALRDADGRPRWNLPAEGG